MSIKDEKLRCDMKSTCESPVTHLDEKGYVYCSEHGQIRKFTMRCRKLEAGEVKHLESGKPLERYEVQS